MKFDLEKIKKYKNEEFLRIAERFKGEDLKNPSEEARHDAGFLIVRSLCI